MLAFAQTGAETTAHGLSISWIPMLGVSLVFVLVVAAFWNRRLAHEKRERRRLEQRLADLTAGLPIGLFEARAYSNGNFKLLFHNKATRDLLRLRDTAASLQLHDPVFTAHLHSEDEAGIRHVIKRSIESLEPIHETFRYMQKDGQYRWMKADITVRVMDDGGVLWTGQLRDLTDERTLNDELRHLTESKDLFFSAASHELRTPVHAIGLALEQMALEQGPASSIALQSAQEASDRLRVLLNDLLELAKVQRADLVLRPRDFSLSGLLSDLSQEFRVALARKSITYRTHVDQLVPDSLTGDHQRLQQVLANLLSNALLFSHGGDISIAVTLAESICSQAEDFDTSILNDGNAGIGQQVLLEFSVTDQSGGISPEQLDRVFEPFVSNQAVASDALARLASETQQFDSPSNRTGLGLAICRRIVERMGGSIWLESELGQGTIARFQIPLQTYSANDQALEIPTIVRPSRPIAPFASRRKRQIPKRRNILLVDDDRLGRTLMSTLLSTEGYLVTEAGTGEEALGKFSHGGFDAVVTDLRMPGMDGESLAVNIRALSSRNKALTPMPRLIALTASLGGGDVQNQANEVFDRRLQKPVAVDQLVMVLES